MGLVEAVHATGEMVPVIPSVAAERALCEHQREVSRRSRLIRQLTSAFATVDGVYETARNTRVPSVTTLRGRRTISQAIESSLAVSKEALVALAGGPEPWPGFVREVTRREDGPGGGELRARVLHQHMTRTGAKDILALERAEDVRVEIRTVDEVPIQFVTCDRDVVYLITELDGAEAVRIRHGPVIWSLVNVFEHLWRRSLPEAGPARGRPAEIAGDLEHSIMLRLVNGDTEEKIARDLGVSRRTVAANVSRISRRLGSASRTQLGYLIAKNHVVDEEPVV